jgi:bisphosphoglycerate-dependent phosphoglycerate mutase
MEQTETDLVNRTITQQTLQRQQQIMTRLLEHERAEMQREKEQRRESREAGDLYSQPSPAELERYQQQLQPAQDQLRTLPPTLAPYYRQKVDDYFFRR